MNHLNHGLILKPIENDHYIFGDGKLGDSPVNPSGQWASWLPVKENQNVGMEPMACTTFALLNCVETMIAKRYGSMINLSDRFLAYVSGTTKQGNDPHTVAETLKKKGNVLEEFWPYTTLEDTWEKFYAIPPQKLYTLALSFIAEFNFGHSWVQDTSQANLMKALTYSPLTAGVYAWQVGDNGYYIRPKGFISTHDVMIFGYEANNYWLIFDSYEQNIKKLSWDYPFDAVKRYTLDRQVVKESAWQTFIRQLRAILGI